MHARCTHFHLRVFRTFAEFFDCNIMWVKGGVARKIHTTAKIDTFIRKSLTNFESWRCQNERCIYLQGRSLGCGCPVDTSAAGRSTDRADRRDRRHYDYLKRHSPTVINAMRLEGSLERYITNFDRDTQEMYPTICKGINNRASVRKRIPTEAFAMDHHLLACYINIHILTIRFKTW